MDRKSMYLIEFTHSVCKRWKSTFHQFTKVLFIKLYFLLHCWINNSRYHRLVSEEFQNGEKANFPIVRKTKTKPMRITIKQITLNAIIWNAPLSSLGGRNLESKAAWKGQFVNKWPFYCRNIVWKLWKFTFTLFDKKFRESNVFTK